MSNAKDTHRDADEGDSLDFTESGERQPPPPGVPPRPKPKPKPKAVAPKPSRKFSPGLLIVSAAALIAGYFLFEENPPPPIAEKKAPSSAARPARQATTPTAPESPETNPPPQASAPTDAAPVIPEEFLKAFEAYRARPGSKAIALALDKTGWAYAAVSNAGSQAIANSEAVKDCGQRKPAGVQAECKLYAEGDKVVW